MLGTPIWDVLIPPDEADAVRSVFENLLGRPERSEFESNWLTRERGVRLIAWRNTCVRDEHGEVRWVVGTGTDITQQRQLEEQLRQAAKLEAVGQLAGGIAHGFNNLLTAIRGYVDLCLREVPEGSQLARDMTQIQGAATRAADLTRQLLTFSRQQVGRPEVIDLNALVQYEALDQRSAVGLHGLAINRDTAQAA